MVFVFNCRYHEVPFFLSRFFFIFVLFFVFWGGGFGRKIDWQYGIVVPGLILGSE